MIEGIGASGELLFRLADGGESATAASPYNLGGIFRWPDTATPTDHLHLSRDTRMIIRINVRLPFIKNILTAVKANIKPAT
jgi:hypothetical protein